MELAEFLAARLDEDIETLSQVALPALTTSFSPWAAWHGGTDTIMMRSDRFAAEIAAKRDHLERHLAARKRHELWMQQDAKNEAPWSITDPATGGNYITTSAAHSAEAAEVVAMWEDVLRLDAAPFSDHPDYDPAWKIDA